MQIHTFGTSILAMFVFQTQMRGAIFQQSAWSVSIRTCAAVWMFPCNEIFIKLSHPGCRSCFHLKHLIGMTQE